MAANQKQTAEAAAENEPEVDLNQYTISACKPSFDSGQTRDDIFFRLRHRFSLPITTASDLIRREGEREGERFLALPPLPAVPQGEGKAE